MITEFDMVTAPGIGRAFTITDRVRLGDVTRGGYLRLDALVRHTQIISNDDTNEAGLEDDLAWIARSTVVDVVQPAVVDEPLELMTFCAGLGRTWAERRVSVRGAAGGRYEVATLWVSIDPQAVRPRRLTPQFLDLYGPSALGRKVSARQRISRPEKRLLADGDRLEWTPRWGDFDTFGHMNNVVYWSALQHALGNDVASGTRLLIEHGAGVEPEDHSEVVVDRGSDRLRMWWLSYGADGRLSDQYLAAAEVVSIGSRTT
ncbi:MAG: acyl-ACP thioesterase domain-containing protein [Acidimicrobiales bacterium]